MPVRESPLVPEGTIVLVERVPAAEMFFRVPSMCLVKNIKTDPIDRIDPTDERKE
jgi:hypothetical protein